ncbi:DNA polymerase family B [seawater metagenome]|uniref:DNA-directed DNA polymerase n=1 Tax=seawater metagenome TaxID=1561972 RepID=A0A5E8CH16_9ZZZZ
MSDKHIEFQIYDYIDSHEYDDSSETPDESEIGNYTIHLFGRTADDKSVYVKVLDYTPYFYVKIPDKWNTNKVNLFVEYIKEKVWGKYKNSLLDYDIVTRHIAFGFTAGKLFKFIRFVFNNHDGMRRYSYIFNNKLRIPRVSNKLKKYKVYESNILPMIRCMHIKDIKGCGWVQINKNDSYLVEEEEEKISRCDIELKVKWTKIKSIEKEEIAPLIIASFDIETYSVDGKFPQAHRPGDEIIQIGTTFSRYGSSECFYQHIVTLKSCDKINGADVESYDNETDVIQAWVRMMNRMGPDIITGYNIFFFDEKYIYDRSCMKNVNCKIEASMWSKLKNHECNFKQITLSSSALGDNHLRYYQTPGIVHIDLMKVIQKDYKLDGWKLDYVASQFVRGKINGIEVDYLEGEKMIKLKADTIQDIQAEDYIHIELIDQNIKDKIGEKFKIIKIIDKDIYLKYDEEIITCEHDGFSLYWSQAKDDVGPQDIFKFQREGSYERGIVAKYCLKDCRLCNLLINKLEIITNNMSMANVCCVPLSFLFFRGQGVKLFSLVAKKYRKENYVLPVIQYEVSIKKGNNIYSGKYFNEDDETYYTLTVNKINKKELDRPKKYTFKKEEAEVLEDGSYEGAIVFDPDPGIYYSPTAVLDYASLYPRSMIHKNLSHETIVLDDLYDNLEEYEYFESTYRNMDGTTTKCRYAKNKDGTLGIIPQILTDLLDERTATKKKMKKESNQFKKKILDGHQLALKITANSLYGQMGAPTSPICLKHIAACTTAIGREMLTLAKKYMEEIFPAIILGLKDANENNDVKVWNKIIQTELKEDMIDNKFNNMIKDWIINNLKDYTLQPIIRYGDTDSVFCDFQFFHSCKQVSAKKSLKVWKKIIFFGRELIEKNLLLEYKALWNNTFNEYFKEINDLELPILPNYYTKSCYQKEELPIQERMFNLLKEFFEESYLPWLWSMKESHFEKRKNFQKVAVNWGSYLVEKHGFDQTNLTKEYLDQITGFITEEISDYVFEPILYFNKDDKRIIKVRFFTNGIRAIDQESLELSIKAGELAGDLIKKRLAFPHDLEYEKTFWPFLILTKKRYVGNKYEFDPKKYKQDSMGIVLKRRDNAPIVKLVCGEIVNILMNEKNPNKALEFTEQAIKNMFEEKYNMKYFIITKTLRDNYKDRTRIAHAVLADRIAIRDPGNKPQSNDRIAYANIVIDGDTKKLLQGDMIETPKFIIENNCKIDYLHYLTNQIMKPALQFLSVAVENAEDMFNDQIMKVNNERKGRTDITSWFKVSKA